MPNQRGDAGTNALLASALFGEGSGLVEHETGDPCGLEEGTALALEKLIIRQLLENWIIWRDSGDWESFATVWHEGGRMNATWFRADAAEFIDACRKSFAAGVRGYHTLGGSSIDVRGSRAVAQSRMQIIQRGKIDEIEVDVTCVGRFVDALEKRAGRWGLVFRQPVYELDRVAPVHPTQVPKLDDELLKSFPVGYRHLAYLQTKLGFKVYNDLPGTTEPAVDTLLKNVGQWLHGAHDSRLTYKNHEID